MILGFHHVGITVPDLSKALAYQHAVLGAVDVLNYNISNTEEHRKVMAIGDAEANVALLRCPNIFLELTEFSSPEQLAQSPRLINEQGYTHYCVQGQQMDTLEQRYSAAGSKFFSAPLDLGTGNDYCYIEDQQGSIIELEALPWAPNDSEYWLGHVTLVTADIKGLSEFYCQILSAGKQPIAAFRNNPAMDKMAGLKDVALKGCWVPSSNMQLEIWQFDQPCVIKREIADLVSRPGISHFALEVTDIEAEITRLSGLGMVFLSEQITGAGSNVVYGRDPDGNIVELIEITQPTSPWSLGQVQYPNRIADLAKAKTVA